MNITGLKSKLRYETSYRKWINVNIHSSPDGEGQTQENFHKDYVAITNKWCALGLQFERVSPKTETAIGLKLYDGTFLELLRFMVPENMTNSTILAQIQSICNHNV